MTTIPHPKIVSRDEWLAERKKLLAHEKGLTKHCDRINAERRRLSMVKIEKDYLLDGPNGKQSLNAIFNGRRQLIVYHFMFDPAWDKGCSGCTGYVDALGDLSMLKDRARPIKHKRNGASRGFPRLAAISITTFTSHWTRKLLPSNTTSWTKRNSRRGRKTSLTS